MRQYGVIAVGYNRPKSLKRLLNALNQADYQNHKITLIISLDYAGHDEILTAAHEFIWEHGKKIVNACPERLGLKNHILKCGDYMAAYSLDAVAIFEDDIMPSPAFFNYMRQAVEYYESDMRIAGISLYTHLWNVNSEKPFYPMTGGSDIFFLQFAQSWGQIWMKKQWAEFKAWYQYHSESFSQAEGVPFNVCHWKDSSWLKYHIRYCVETNKYFVYPYEALCTNFTDMGEHHAYSTSLFQVPLQTDSKKQYRLISLTEAPVVYDAFFENTKIAQNINLPDQELCIDIYGTKQNAAGKKYWLTTHNADYQIVKTYGLKLRPHELNIIFNIEGSEIKLYHTEETRKNPKNPYEFYKCYDYYFRISHCTWKDLLRYLIDKFKIRLK